MDAQLKRGLLDICVLAGMRDEPTYGYKLIRDVSPYIEISESTLYPILKRLESGGFVTVRSAEHNGRLRKYYSITPSGLDRLNTFIEDWAEVMRVYSFIEGRKDT
jgi:PadR family transcriptional regulator PadR